MANVISRFKQLTRWEQILLFCFVLVLVGFFLAEAEVIKLPASRSYDCSTNHSYITIEVQVADKFNPQNTDAYLCDRLKFVAMDANGHWPKSNSKILVIDSKTNLAQGQIYEIILSSPGQFNFFDQSHPGEQGSVNVHDKPRQGQPPQQRPTSEKDVYLTFDADMTAGMRSRGQQQGIVWYDPRLVDYLEKQNVPATVFVTGMFGQMYPQVVSSLSYNVNIEIGNHTYDHAAFEKPCYNLPIITSIDQKKNEILKTQEILNNLIGYEPKFFRYPGLCHNQADDQLVQSLGLRLASSEVASGDAFSHDSDQITKHVLNNLKPGSVIVMHLGGPNAPATYEALTKLVPEIQKEGYTLAALPDNNDLAVTR